MYDEKIIIPFIGNFLLITPTACTANKHNVSANDESNLASVWRCSAVNYEGSLVLHYKYDSNGKIQEIAEYQNENVIGDSRSVSVVKIMFDEKGCLSSVTTSVSGMTAEVVDEKTWTVYSDNYSFTVTYNNLYLCEKQVRDFGNIKITDTTKYDENGKALSLITDTEFYEHDETSRSITSYDYEYDSNGNHIIQYALTENGRVISATYSWENYR